VLDAVERTGWRRTPSRLVGNIAFWFVMFVVILVAAHALGLSSLTNVFSELVSYIPSVIAALVIILAIFMALQELGIATEIVTTAFAIIFGALALALALSFGLGNQKRAGEITREWYERLRAERETIAWENTKRAARESKEVEEVEEGPLDEDEPAG
jgi:hypothetical protein